MQDLINTTANITHYAADRDPFESFANDVAPRELIGKPLRFTQKGDYILGYKDDEESVPLGSHMLVVMPLLLSGWVKWQDKKPVDRKYARVTFFERAPERRALGDTDETLWELVDGKRKDPWSESKLLPMIRPADGTACTFQTKSWGGTKAIAELSRAYMKVRGKGEPCLPVIELQSRTRQGQRGPVEEPVFKLVDWEPVAEHEAALAEAGILELLAEQPPPLPPPLPPAGNDFAANARTQQATAVEMDDEIPF